MPLRSAAFSCVFGHCFPSPFNPAVENTTRTLRTDTNSSESRDLTHKTIVVTYIKLLLLVWYMEFLFFFREIENLMVRLVCEVIEGSRDRQIDRCPGVPAVAIVETSCRFRSEIGVPDSV